MYAANIANDSELETDSGGENLIFAFLEVLYSATLTPPNYVFLLKPGVARKFECSIEKCEKEDSILLSV